MTPSLLGPLHLPRARVPVTATVEGCHNQRLRKLDAITAAKARGTQFVLCDTAGRQHSKSNLMAELEKVRKVTNKALGRDPDEVLLVIDANTGQNAIRQAEEFTKSAGVTGLILTKLDGTARGGALIGVYDQLKVPIKFIGTGEKVTDLKDFKPDEFAAGLFDD